jgi:hypothetical protein
MKLVTSAVLTVNHVFDILAEQFNTKDWGKSLHKVIPERKIETDEKAFVNDRGNEIKSFNQLLSNNLEG